jgi:hypothetical protein
VRVQRAMQGVTRGSVQRHALFTNHSSLLRVIPPPLPLSLFPSFPLLSPPCTRVGGGGGGGTTHTKGGGTPPRGRKAGVLSCRHRVAGSVVIASPIATQGSEPPAGTTLLRGKAPVGRGWRVLFFGSDDIALATLALLSRHQRHDNRHTPGAPLRRHCPGRIGLHRTHSTLHNGAEILNRCLISKCSGGHAAF